MHNIFLLNTRHDSVGRCNSDELFQIFENLKPEVIFEELPPSSFDEFYVIRSRSNLESEAIFKYSQAYNIKHIPVDSDNVPSAEFFKNYQKLIERIEGLADKNGFTFRSTTDANRNYISQYGFQYLNSDNCVKVNAVIYDAIIGGLTKINDVELFQTFKNWYDVHDKREHHMLENIYQYSAKNSYITAVFTIGSAHRESIIKKITEYQKRETIKLTWKY